MKTTEEIYQSLLAAFAQRAGFTPEADCDLAVRLYAAAAELQALGIQGEWVLDQSFPQTAGGAYLDYHAQMRGITRTAATKAAGTLRFSVERAAAADLTIAAGTVCMTAEEVRFQTTEAVVLKAGELTADAPAEALEPGRSGNAAAGTIRILTACPVGITGCTNPAPFTGGSDQEDDESLRSRILEPFLDETYLLIRLRVRPQGQRRASPMFRMLPISSKSRTSGTAKPINAVRRIPGSGRLTRITSATSASPRNRRSRWVVASQGSRSRWA